MTATDPVQAAAQSVMREFDCERFTHIDGHDYCRRHLLGWLTTSDVCPVAQRAARAATIGAGPILVAEALREAADWIRANPDDLDCEAEASGIAANRLRACADDLEAGHV